MLVKQNKKVRTEISAADKNEQMSTAAEKKDKEKKKRKKNQYWKSDSMEIIGSAEAEGNEQNERRWDF